MSLFRDVFISYGRADSREFAAKLTQELLEAGLKVWFDFEDIPLGVDYQKQIDDGIDKSDNFIFIISPHAVNSSHCELEINYALNRNKRILPVMHVEEISRETWQARHPEGTDAEWEAYQAAGKHSSHPNMHPAIRKINWVYFREGVDTFEEKLQDLLVLFERDRDYVRQHTVLLNRALTWKRNHRRVSDLLVEAPLLQAEVWLKTEFPNRQPPCEPTGLHCQFIAESLKNAQDGMTEAFICYADEDRDTLQQVYLSLARAGLTVWTSTQDIQMGVEFKEAIKQGIETADNVVYLLSLAAVRSPWCQQEIEYALQLNKRIIPVLIEPLDLEKLPSEIATLQFVNLAHADPGDEGALDQKNLLSALRQDADYYRDGKQLLVKALKWERQLQNPCILARGYALRQMTAWLKIAQKHEHHRPLPIQEKFIQASLNQPQDVSINVFITADSKDLAFARRLNETLQVQGERTWFEPEKTVLGADYSLLVNEGIARAENVIVIVSQDGLTDATVREELATAEALSKRIIAVSYQPGVMSLLKRLKDKLTKQSINKSAETFERSHLPPSLAASPWVDFSDRDGDFMSNFGHLYRILKSHPDHVRDHTRLLMRATEWKQNDYDDSALLRSKEVKKAERWLRQAWNQSPQPSELHEAYIQASRELALRKVKRRSVWGMSVGVTFLVLILRVMGLLQGVELFAYDHLLRLRPAQDQDDRFLLVEVDNSSGSFIREGLIQRIAEGEGGFEPSIGTLPDDALEQVLQILDENQARLIGLDFIRDFPASGPLAATLANTDNLIAICKHPYEGKAGAEKPPEVPVQRVGFADFLDDDQSGEGIIRRHYIMQKADPEFCDTSASFSLLLADRYLQQEGIRYTSPVNPEGGFQGDGLRFEHLVVPNLNIGRGPYYNLADAAFYDGYQALLNFKTFRHPDKPNFKDPNAFAPAVSLEDLLKDKVPREQIEDRIVLIGYTDRTDRNADYKDTPLGLMPGFIVQGQMASQLISAALDDDAQPLIRWWPFGGEVLWILGWAIAGGVIVRQFVRLSRSAIVIAIGIGVLYGSCYLAMVHYALWIPLWPPLLAFLLTAGAVSVLNYRLRHP
jgi:CHASE2 domain-containing sensor protein